VVVDRPSAAVELCDVVLQAVMTAAMTAAEASLSAHW
jgi:hypothetical protein